MIKGIFKLFGLFYFAIGFCMFVLFLFSFGERPSNISQLSFAEKSIELVLDKSRTSLRGFYGKIVPMHHTYFNNLTKNQKERLPDPKKALIQVDHTQMRRFVRMGKSFRRTQRDFSRLGKALIKHFSS